MGNGLFGVVASGSVAVALACASAVMLLAGAPRAQPPPAPTAPLPLLAASSDMSPVDRGRTLFQRKGCIGCHSVTDKGLVSRSPMAPDLSALAARAGVRRPGLAADEYVKESVRQPQAYMVPGFGEIQMPMLPVDDAELEALTAFLLAPARP